MWLINSSIGKKVVMSLSGLFLVLFLTFHACMNVVAVISGDAYNMICELLGANWYALVGCLVLVAGIAIHFGYATWLTLTNKTARGNNQYAVQATAPGVTLNSKNMYVLGIIIIGFFVLHLTQFWAHMQLVDIAGCEESEIGSSTDGAAFIAYYFSNPIFCILYLVWFGAIWYHITHGIWSAFHTLGLNNSIWLNRWKCVATIWASIIFLLFAAVVVVFFARSLCDGACCAA